MKVTANGYSCSPGCNSVCVSPREAIGGKCLVSQPMAFLCIVTVCLQSSSPLRCGVWGTGVGRGVPLESGPISKLKPPKQDDFIALPVLSSVK